MYISHTGEVHSHKLPGILYYSFSAEELTEEQLHFGIFNGTEALPSEILVNTAQRDVVLLEGRTKAKNKIIQQIKRTAPVRLSASTVTLTGGKVFICDSVTILKTNSLHDMLQTGSGITPKYLVDATGALVSVTLAEIEEYAALVETKMLAFQNAAGTKIGEVTALFDDPLKTIADISAYDITTGWPA